MHDINLYSDTQTRPTAAMRQAMAVAEVGDEQRGEDPTVNRLCEKVAAYLGKDAAVFLPSGTMCNQIALLVHCDPGDEVVADHTCHVVAAEAGAAAALAGVQVHTVVGTNGVFGADQIDAAIRRPTLSAPRTRLVCVEQSSNLGGGTVWPLAALEAVADRARAHGLAIHMDGARLPNAAVAAAIPAARFAAQADSVWLDLSKGLGCPVGAVLAGTTDFIDEAWRWKKRLGGAMRQAGVLAAAGIYALDHHIERLAEDHENARHFADRIADLPGLTLDPGTVDTNIVFFDVSATGRTANDLVDHLSDRGVRIGAMGTHRLRAVTHLDVNRANIDTATEVLHAVIG